MSGNRQGHPRLSPLDRWWIVVPVTFRKNRDHSHDPLDYAVSAGRALRRECEAEPALDV